MKGKFKIEKTTTKEKIEFLIGLIIVVAVVTKFMGVW